MRWSSDVVWLHVLSDAVTALAYYVIPIALIYFVRKRKDLAFHWMFVAFGIFILACGTTHVMSIVTLWYPAYRIEGLVKAITALASILTAIVLVKMMPAALNLPSPDDLRREIERRVTAEQELRILNGELEQRVSERTLRLDRYNKALQSIAYISSHDLREPVRTVASFTQLLERRCRGKLAGTEIELMTHILTGSRRMQQLIDDLSEYTRAVHMSEEARTTAVRPAEASVALKGAMDVLSAVFERTGAKVEARTELPVVALDELPLQLVFQNLLGNAVKYCEPSRSPRIEVTAQQEGDFCLFTIRDNGIGLDMAYAETVFQPFKRLHGSDVPGSGVGLAICKNIVESYGGRIWVESAGSGQGASFHFTVPSKMPVHA